jgi:transcriptional regulator with XRE-family HTH domain
MRTPGQVAGDFSRKIGQRIRWIREIQDLTMGEIQNRCGIQAKTLARYERGVISISANAIEQLAGALNVSPTRLCGPVDDFSQLVREQVGAIEAPLDLANGRHEP